MSRIQKLESEIIKHKAFYYQGRPQITDAEYDNLEADLRKLDPKNPTLLIVGSTTSASDKIKHDKKMLSLEKTYVLDDLISWKSDEDILSTMKLDGISCSIIFQDGELFLAKTRGDGSFGENITKKVMWITNVPKVIAQKNKVEIRGELFCDEKSFFELSKEMTDMGLEKPTSQRNIVAGLVGRKDNLELCRYIKFMAFDYLSEERLKTEKQKFDLLTQIGFLIPEVEVHNDKKSIESTIEKARDFMNEGDYQIDGVVFTFNKMALHEELGETSHHPRYKMAFKFAGESKQTKIKEIIWSVSRNGILTPVADVEPVELSGAVISRVTLHNYGMVAANNLKTGDEIEIIRSGEVIPKFLSVVKPSKNKFKVPDRCPSCDSKVEMVDIRLFCRNDNCPGKNLEIILNFIQKIGIEDLSGKRLEELINAKLVKTIPDLYKLEVADLMKIDKVKEKLSNKLIDSIQKTMTTDLITFLSALGLTGGAYSKCEKVVRAGFDSIKKIENLSIDQLMGVESFAEKSATEFMNSLKEKKDMIQELVELGFEFTVEETRETKVSGLKICITGALSEKRPVIEDMIREGGGIVVSSVSKNTDILVTNETDPSSSKFKKALELKIKTITEEQLLNLLK
ncbi:MAG: NAD-dependent DNA ligase LigA [Bacteriovorax sp.]|nr:NAD-dependent DNA ligase LigA [Bacteriovorax sp.]